MKTHPLALALALLAGAATLANSATVSAPSAQWTPLIGNFDYADDLQPGHADNNIIGSTTNFGFLVTHNTNGTASNADGTFGFRLRLDGPGGNKNKIAYHRAAYVGIDANSDNTIDVLIGLDFSGSKNELGIYAPGPGPNHSPASFSIEGTPVKTYTVTSANYNYRPVDYTVDGGTTNDLNPGHKAEPDYYLSMLVDFADIVSYLGGQGIHITDQTSLRYVAATSAQGNKFNGDIAGVNGSENSDSTWTELGVFTQTVTLAGFMIPEPSSAMLFLLGAMPIMRRARAT